MKQMRRNAIAASAFVCTALLSFGWSEQDGASLSVQGAQARVGRPLTPVSVAGVARRQNRRAGYGYGAGVVGAGVAGAAALGTAAAVAATSPNWGWGGNPYYSGPGYYQRNPYYYTGAGNYGVTGVSAARGGGPSYGGGVFGANAYQPPPDTSASYAGTWPTQFDCHPGTLVRPGNGLVYRCW
jgi:hypothetical protein